MSQPNQSPSQGKPDTLRVRLLTRYVRGYKQTGEKSFDGSAITVEDTLEAGTVIELPREEAQSLLSREFDGYPTQRDTKWTEESSGGATVNPRPHANGRVKNPLAELVA